MGCIYLVTNKVNGKQYVGKTVKPFPYRRKEHEWTAVRSPKYAFHRALRKYGLDAFEWEEVYSNVANEDLDRLEMECIRWYGTEAPKGYNLTRGGDGAVSGWNKGMKMPSESLETRAKKRQAQRKRFSTIRSRVECVELHMGHPVSEETRKKFSQSRTSYHLARSNEYVDKECPRVYSLWK